MTTINNTTATANMNQVMNQVTISVYNDFHCENMTFSGATPEEAVNALVEYAYSLWEDMEAIAGMTGEGTTLEDQLYIEAGNGLNPFRSDVMNAYLKSRVSASEAIKAFAI